jgi:hypothetical protein
MGADGWYNMGFGGADAPVHFRIGTTKFSPRLLALESKRVEKRLSFYGWLLFGAGLEKVIPVLVLTFASHGLY